MLFGEQREVRELFLIQIYDSKCALILFYKTITWTTISGDKISAENISASIFDDIFGC